MNDERRSKEQIAKGLDELSGLITQLKTSTPEGILAEEIINRYINLIAPH
jgi:hypothetical protein